MEDKMYTYTQNVIAQIVDEKDKYLKETIIKYAQEQSKQRGERIEVLFLDKAVADKIIDLGIKEYTRLKESPIPQDVETDRRIRKLEIEVEAQQRMIRLLQDSINFLRNRPE
jgi:predicted metal-dependent hydrolase